MLWRMLIDHLASVNDSARSLIGTRPDIDRAVSLGARLDRDQLVAFILEQLPAEP
jgi:hypothetical protein